MRVLDELAKQEGGPLSPRSMSPHESTPEATLFDLRTSEAPQAAPLLDRATESAPSGSAAEPAGSEGDDEAELAETDADAQERQEATPYHDRKRIEEQLDALKRKEVELRRALVVTDHPDLAEPIRLLGSRAYAVTRAEAKLAQGLSKGEVRRREGIEKKLSGLRAKREELEGQINVLEAELGELGSERLATFEAERRQAMEQLLIALGQHEETLRTAGLEASVLVPEIGPWLPELEKIAKTLIADRA
jgi:hypothetical protein